MSEAAIRRLVGGRAVMAEQLEHLLELSRLPTISLRVLPFVAGAHAAMGSSFSILVLPPPQAAKVVYMEDFWSGVYVNSPSLASRSRPGRA